ncbi:MAG: DUF406 family protein [Klebsiella sp.]|nr:DUF406 family protein [Klebsiella sp.]
MLLVGTCRPGVLAAELVGPGNALFACTERERALAAAPASEPPQVDYTIAPAGDEAKLEASIAFSCQAEKIIFELSLRNVI